MTAQIVRRGAALLSFCAIIAGTSQSAWGATTFMDVTAIGVTGTTLDSVTIQGGVIPFGSFLPMVPNTLQNATTRSVILDGAVRPATNQGVWDLVSDRDLDSGLQTLLGPAGEYLDLFYVGGPNTTANGVDVVIIDSFTGSLGAYSVTALDSSGVPIAATTADIVYGPGGLYTTNPTDFDEVNTSVGGPAGAPVYGAHFDVGALTATSIGVDFDTGLLLGGIRITSTAGNALETTEIFGLQGGSVPEPHSAALIVVGAVVGSLSWIGKRRRHCTLKLHRALAS